LNSFHINILEFDPVIGLPNLIPYIWYMNDNKLAKIIDDSPLSDEDKVHWNEILPKLSEENKQRLEHALVAKTEVFHAREEIKKTLDTIKRAESEAEEETKEESPKPTPEPATPAEQPSTESTSIPPLNPAPTAEEIQKIKDEQDMKLASLREEIKQISVTSHGTAPPSYT